MICVRCGLRCPELGGDVLLRTQEVAKGEFVFEYGSQAEAALLQAKASLELAQAQATAFQAKADELQATEAAIRSALEKATQKASEDKSAAEKAQAQVSGAGERAIAEGPGRPVSRCGGALPEGTVGVGVGGLQPGSAWAAGGGSTAHRTRPRCREVHRLRCFGRCPRHSSRWTPPPRS